MRRVRELSAKVHLWLGLSVGAFLVLMGVTGSVLVFSHEIDRALAPELFVVRPGATGVPLDRIVAAVAERHPGAAPTRVRMPQEPDGSAQVWLGGPTDRIGFVDPYTGTYLGSRIGERTFTGFLFDLHAHLLAGETGGRIAGVGALATLLLCATGMVVWWPGRKKLRTALTVKWGAARKRVNYDVHRAGGAFSLLFLVLTALTGASLVFHEAFQAGLDALTRSAPRPVAPVVAPPASGEMLPFRVLVAAADRAMPEGRATYITFPARPEAPFVVRKKLDVELHPNGRTFVYVDPFTAAVLAVEDARTTPRGTRAYNVLYPLHIGAFGGTAVRALWVLLGLSPALLFATGFYIWWGKLTARRRREARPAGTVPRPERRVVEPV